MIGNCRRKDDFGEHSEKSLSCVRKFGGIASAAQAGSQQQHTYL